MKKVTVLRLSGCSYCEELVGMLEARKIEFESIDADSNSDLADEIEDLLDVFVYPIVILETSSKVPSFLFRASNYDQTHVLPVEGGVKKGFISMDHLVQEIINFI